MNDLHLIFAHLADPWEKNGSRIPQFPSFSLYFPPSCFYCFAMLNPLLPRSFHEHQYVKVAISPTKTEIGIVVSVTGDQAVVSTRHGYNITVNQSQLQRAFLLVLDLNGVLGVRQRRGFDKRPHVEKFIKYALSNFVVSVWTSCEERNGKLIIEDLFGDDRDRLLFTLFRSHCTPNPTPEKPFGTKKDLQTIFSRWPESFHAVNTIIVDDSPDKCSHPDLALCPTQFDGDSSPEDAGLLTIMETLDQILREDSVEPLILVEKERQRVMRESASPIAMPPTVVSQVSGLCLADGNSPVVVCGGTTNVNETVMNRLRELMAQLPSGSPSKEPSEGSSRPVSSAPPPPFHHAFDSRESKKNHRHRPAPASNQSGNNQSGNNASSVVALFNNARRVQQS